jgi:hypothetical protein
MAETNSAIEERIRERAYELYLSRGCQDGQELADWLTAEQEFGDASEVELPARAKVRAVGSA